MDLNVLIMAAGLGTRMKSRRAKVLHRLAGQPLINFVYRAALELGPRRIVVIVGHQADLVEKELNAFCDRLASRGRTGDLSSCVRPEFVLQAEQKGTGHAVMSARDALSEDSSHILLLSGDVPLVEPKTLWRLIDHHKKNEAAATVLTTRPADPTGYGRIVRDELNDFSRIVEHRDAASAELSINEINSGIYCFEPRKLFASLNKLTPANAQGEYYLTDALSVLRSDGERVSVFDCDHAEEVLGINNRIELASAEKKMRRKKIEALMLGGVTIVDPDTTFIDFDVEIGIDTVIHPFTIIEGNTAIGQDCAISKGVHLVDCRIGDGVVIKDNCLITDSILENGSSVGPFAHLRMSAYLNEGAVVGNFVEVKKSSLGKRTKAMHLTYLGDATLGNGVNIGAGTVTCNYDGKNKHPTTIEDEVRIGSDTMLVAPVRVGKGSVTGAGSVVIDDIPEYSLAVGVPAKVKKRLR